MARREAYAYVRPPSEEEKDFPQVLKVEGDTVTLKESSSRTRSLAVDGVYENDLVETEKYIVRDVDNSSNKTFLFDEAMDFYQKKEFKKAFQLFLLLSNYDHDLSMFQLARMYEKGLGVKKDIILSGKWKERMEQL